MMERIGKIFVSVIALICVINYVIYSLLGRLEPFELFNVLLLAAVIIIAFYSFVRKIDLLIPFGMIVLIAAHLFFIQKTAPDKLTSGAILLANLLVFYTGIKINKFLPSLHWYVFAAGYFLLYIIFIVILNNSEPLFIMFLFALAACARSIRLTAYFWAVVISFTFCQPYSWPALFILFFVITVIYGAKGNVRSILSVVFLGSGVSLLLFVLLPVIIILTGENTYSIELILKDSRFLSALRLTMLTATISTFLLFIICVPAAYAIARLRFPGRALLLSLADLPIIIPQSAAGIALLHVFGRKQIIGSFFANTLGIPIDGTLVGIIIAQIFVSMPFLLRSAVVAFESVDEEMELAARSLGASPWLAFRKIAVPLAFRGIALGSVLAWARAAGEFGAVIFIAPVPETAPVLAYNSFNIVGMSETRPMVALLLFFSLAMFFLLQWLTRILPAARYAPFFASRKKTSQIDGIPYDITTEISSYTLRKTDKQSLFDILEIKDAQVKLGGFSLGPVSLKVRNNDYIFVLGHSGCGKTTLLKIVAGFIQPDSGKIKLMGENAERLAPEKRNIGYVSQSVSLFPHLSVEENIKFGPFCKGLDARSRDEACFTAAKLAGAIHLLDRMPETLSGGEKRRVAIARALATKPLLLLLDEPLSMLDSDARLELMEMLALIHSSGIPIIHVTHHPEEINVASARVVKMEKGKFVE